MGALPWFECRMVMPSGGWNDSKLLARALLRDRQARRRLILRLLWVPLLMLAAGRWGIDEWLAEHPLRFLAWWGTCGVLTLMVILFAVYDALAVIREERDKLR